MTQQKDDLGVDSLFTELSKDDLKKIAKALKKANKLARKRNRLARQQYQQSVLDYELAERQYLIDKSALQPRFRISITEFLSSEPDFINDPEQASEAKFLSECGVAYDSRALRIKVHVKGDAPYMRPRVVIKQRSQEQIKDERVFSMTELIHFIDVDSLDVPKGEKSTTAFLVYRDRTSLPVLHKYRLTQRQDAALLRWDAEHLDTLYANTQHDLRELNTSTGCEALFRGRVDL